MLARFALTTSNVGKRVFMIQKSNFLVTCCAPVLLLGAAQAVLRTRRTRAYAGAGVDKMSDSSAYREARPPTLPPDESVGDSRRKEAEW